MMVLDPNHFLDVCISEVKEEEEESHYVYETSKDEEFKPVLDALNTPEKTPFILVEQDVEETADGIKVEDVYIAVNHETDVHLYNCPMCDYNGQVKYYLKKHILRCHPNNNELMLNFICPFCHSQFEGLTNYHQHCLKEHSELLPKANCNICFKEFASNKSANIHKKVAHENYRISCPECEKEVTSKQGLLQHIQKTHRGDSLIAVKQTKSINIKTAFSVDGEANKQFSCSGCDYSSPIKQNVKKHVKTVHGEDVAKGKELFPCPNCDKTFLGVPNLHRHAKEEHNLFMKLDYTCIHCSKEFSKRSNLQTHIQSVHEGIRYKCEFCDKELSTLGNKTLHLKNVHPDIYMY